MADDDKALVERLRDFVIVEDIDLAADRIEALSAENERMREVLQDVTPAPHFGESEQSKAWWAKARAALGETK